MCFDSLPDAFVFTNPLPPRTPLQAVPAVFLNAGPCGVAEPAPGGQAGPVSAGLEVGLADVGPGAVVPAWGATPVVAAGLPGVPALSILVAEVAAGRAEAVAGAAL